MTRWTEQEKKDIWEEAKAKKADLALVELARFLNAKVDDPAEKNIKEEISSNLTPFIEERENKRFLSDNPYYSLNKLLKTVNSLPLKIKWVRGPDIRPAEYYQEGRRGLRIPGDKNRVFIQSYPDFEADEPRPRLGFYKSGEGGHDIFYLRNHGFSPKALRLAFYYVIVQALESAELNRFGKCPRCGNFFVAGKGQKYCNLECTMAADKEKAPSRMKEYRKKIDRNIRNEGFPKLVKLAELIRKFRKIDITGLVDRIPELSKFRKHVGENFEEFEPVIEKIKQRQTEDDVLWRKLPPRFKKALAEISF